MKMDTFQVAMPPPPTDSYSVESERTASRKPLQAFPGFQDFKNGPETLKSVNNLYFCRIFCNISSLKRAYYLLFGVAAVVTQLKAGLSGQDGHVHNPGLLQHSRGINK